MRTRLRTLLAATTFLLAAVPAARAQAGTRPDFSGTWVLDAARNVADGQMSPPSAATYVVVQRGDTLTVDRDVTTPDMGPTKSRFVFGFDGKAWPNSVPQPNGDIAVSSTLSWQGDTLAIHTTAVVQEVDVVQEETWAIGDAGKTLTLHQVTTVNGEAYADLTLTFARKN